jgi:hypothetical protein
MRPVPGGNGRRRGRPGFFAPGRKLRCRKPSSSPKKAELKLKRVTTIRSSIVLLLILSPSSALQSTSSALRAIASAYRPASSRLITTSSSKMLASSWRLPVSRHCLICRLINSRGEVSNRSIRTSPRILVLWLYTIIELYHSAATILTTHNDSARNIIIAIRATGGIALFRFTGVRASGFEKSDSCRIEIPHRLLSDDLSKNCNQLVRSLEF